MRKMAGQIWGQISVYDYLESIGKAPDPEVGEYVERTGAVICHIMRPSYIGHKILFNCSTASLAWFQVGILEAYVPYEDRMRSIINVGKKQRILYTHYPGCEIYELHPWNWEARKPV